MKKYSKILAIPFAIVLIASTLGFSVTRHYCMGMMVKESFYSPHHSCDDEIDKGCHSTTHSETFKKDCCEDENLSIAGINVISPHKKQVLIDYSFLPPAFYQVYKDLLPITGFSPKEFSNYIVPPKPDGRQILIRVQRFLI